MAWEIPPEIEDFRDQHWHREGTLRIETVQQAERFIERAGFTACLTDSRKPGPSLYVAVCGRRDAVMPHNVQKDPESSHTWRLKDEIVGRGKVFYAKMARGKTLFIAPRMVTFFYTIWGMTRSDQKKSLSEESRALLKVLRKEWEMGTADLRAASGLKDRRSFIRALDELQAAMIVIPSEVVYMPKFTYIWTLAEGRFPEEMARRSDRKTALREIARSFLKCAGMTAQGELARVTGLSRPDAGIGNRALVEEGFAISPESGSYHLKLLSDLNSNH
jgi:hypothetical protein